MGPTDTTRRVFVSATLAAAVAQLAGCGGGGGSDASPPASPLPTPPAAPIPPPPPPPPPPPLIETLDVRVDGAARSTAWPVAAPVAVRSLLVLAMGYDPVRDLLLAAVLDSASQSQLLALSPADLGTVWSLPLAEQTTALDVAEDGSWAYVGLRNGQVLKVDLTTRGIAQQFDITEGRGTAYFPIALAVRPGASDTVAVSTGSWDTSGAFVAFHRLAMWQGGVFWPQMLSVGPDLNNPAGALKFADATTLFTMDTEFSSNVVLKVLVGNRSLQALFPGLAGQYGSSRLDRFGDDILMSEGQLIEPSGFKIKRWMGGVNGTVVPLPGLGELCDIVLLSTNATGGFELRAATLGASRQEQLRRLRWDLPTLQTSDGRRPSIAGLQPLGRGRLAVHLYENITGRTQLIVLDVESVAALSPQPVTVVQGSAAGVQVTAVSHAFTHLAYDGAGERIVAGVAASAGPNGCTLVTINPATGGEESRFLLSSPPGRVFASKTGRIAYVSLPDERALQQVLLGPGGGLGWRIEGLPSSVLDLAISPADNEIVAFTVESQGPVYVARRGALVAAIGEYFPDVRFNSSVHFAAADSVVGANHYTTSNQLQRYRFDGSSLVETSRTDMPGSWGFSFAWYVGDLMYTSSGWARQATAELLGWILPPEAMEFLVQYGYVPPFEYSSVALLDERSGHAMRVPSGATVHLDRLATRAVSSLGGDLVGSRRVNLLDSARSAPPPGTQFFTVMAGAGRSASLSTPPGATDATIYIVVGL